VLVKLEFPVIVNAVGRLQQKKQQIRTRSMEMDSSGAPHGGVPHGANSTSSGHIATDGGGGGAASPSNQCAYAFVLATVGDVKVFHYQAATQAVLRRVAARVDRPQQVQVGGSGRPARRAD
jgi:hypothetical protein